MKVPLMELSFPGMKVTISMFICSKAGVGCILLCKQIAEIRIAYIFMLIHITDHLQLQPTIKLNLTCQW